MHLSQIWVGKFAVCVMRDRLNYKGEGVARDRLSRCLTDTDGKFSHPIDNNFVSARYNKKSVRCKNFYDENLAITICTFHIHGLFLADRSRAFGTLCCLSVCLSVVCDFLYCGETTHLS